MSGYILINNYSNLGKTGISRRAVVSIAEKAVGEVEGAAIARKERKGVNALGDLGGAKLALTKDGLLQIKLNVVIEDPDRLGAICEAIQKQVASAISMSCDTLPCEVSIKIVKVGK